MSVRTYLLAVAVLPTMLALDACTGAVATSAPHQTPTAVSAATSSAAPPVDPSIEPVSLSHPTAEEARVLELCQVSDHPGTVRGIGQIAHARDATHYAGLTGIEPEIQTDNPAWLVQFRGPIDFRIANQTWIDPVCIVVGSANGFYAVGPTRDDITGAVSTPLPATPPDRSLPAPLP